MGFMKSLFKDKLGQQSQGLDDGPLDVARSAQSEIFRPRPPHGEPQLSSPAADKKVSFLESESGSPGKKERSGGEAHAAPSPVPAREMQSSKSFSYAQHASRREALHAAAAEASLEDSRPRPSVAYSSISQFNNKVELYRGSISTVYKGHCIQTKQSVIIKAYRKSKMSEKHVHKMHREIEILQLLDGPYVCDFYAYFEDSSHHFIIMEYCQGGDLFKRMLMNGGILDEHWVCTEIIAPILRILEKMHAMHILHRDIKPENIFLTKSSKFKLGDFGLALQTMLELPFSRSGTLDYMAPEVLRNPSTDLQESRERTLEELTALGVRPYDGKVDVWAVGILAYELVCGKPPFEVDDEAQTAALIMYSNTIRFPHNRSPEWVDFVRSALIKKPSQRPSAAELLNHPWITSHLRRALDAHPAGRPTKEMLLRPLPPAPLHVGPGTLAPPQPNTFAPLTPQPARSQSVAVRHEPNTPGSMRGAARPPASLDMRAIGSALNEVGSSPSGGSPMAASSSPSPPPSARTGPASGSSSGRAREECMLPAIGRTPSMARGVLKHGMPQPPPKPDDDLESADHSATGMKYRVKSYFNRQAGQ